MELSLELAITLAKFRLTKHKLLIEKGRWENKEQKPHICNLFNKNNIFFVRIQLFMFKGNSRYQNIIGNIVIH